MFGDVRFASLIGAQPTTIKGRVRFLAVLAKPLAMLFMASPRSTSLTCVDSTTRTLKERKPIHRTTSFANCNTAQRALVNAKHGPRFQTTVTRTNCQAIVNGLSEPASNGPQVALQHFGVLPNGHYCHATNILLNVFGPSFGVHFGVLASSWF